ncbi:MAG: fluoride efflux transporter CrcB [Candidatus Gastranaerophilales bacterium]|nr:fluoride efflux transporter CrcB [Candidatus Gastranaerophilales bacterium]
MGIALVFLGGAAGTLLRYIISIIFHGYPYNIAGTFVVNLTGCFIIGFVSYLAIKRNHFINPELKKFFTIGLAGALTTFSAFCYDILVLFLNHHYMIGILNIFFSIILGLIFVSWGINCGFYMLSTIIKQKHYKLKEEKTT